jgi:hypothetical protein
LVLALTCTGRRVVVLVAMREGIVVVEVVEAAEVVEVAEAAVKVATVFGCLEAAKPRLAPPYFHLWIPKARVAI